MKSHPASPPGSTRRKRLPSFVALALMGVTVAANAVTVAPSDRQDINLGQQQWKYDKQLGQSSNPNDPTTYPPFNDSDAIAQPGFDDSQWPSVGLPHAANDFTTFINQESGGGQGSLDGEVSWYRTKLTNSASYSGKKVMLEIEGAHTADRVYVNGEFIPGTGQLTEQNGPDAGATHVIGFLPHIVDLTPYLKFDGTDVLAVKVARSGFFEDPGFSGAFRFGQAEEGLFRPVKLHVTNLVHIPENVFSGQETWGTYVGTQSLSDDHSSAVVRVQTNVENDTAAPQQVTLITQIVDANGNEVARAQQDKTIAVTPPLGQRSNALLPSSNPSFDQTLTVNNPTLWYPNNSTEGKPYLYHVIHTVSINGQVVDAKQSTLGIRVITWDKDFPYINGKKQYLWGGSGRYDYPALGSSVPEEQQWRDLKDMAAMGGNLWRPGHSPSSPEFVDAADALGVFIVQPSGDGENGFANECDPTDQQCNDMWTIKREVHRDIVVRDRSHPSILAWEHDNGQMDTPFAVELRNEARAWDNINPRAAADRTPNDKNGDILSCSKAGCETHLHQVDFPDKPAWGAEYWGPGGSRSAYDTELAFALNYLTPYSQARLVNTFGMAQWYFADTPGETIEQVDGLEDATHFTFGLNPDGSIATHPDGTQVKNFRHNSRGNNASMTDADRFPRMLYYVYESVWVPYSIHPMVKLANTWNRTGQVQVNGFTNCPAARLLVNGTQVGTDQVPNDFSSIDNDAYNAENGAVDENTGKIVGVDKAEQTTKLPGQVHWDNVTWAPGTAVLQCVDAGVVRNDGNGNPVQDTLFTAGKPDHIDLEVVNTNDPIKKPDGSVFQITANGSDAAFIVAKVVDAQDHLVPDATQLVNFDVTSGDSLVTYQGGTQSYVDYSAGEDGTNDPVKGTIAEPKHFFHSPGSHELQFEGGLQKIALRTKFATGNVQVTATAPGLTAGTVTFTINPVPAAPSVSGPPSIIAQPEEDDISVGDVGHFTVTASGAPPLTFTWKKNGVEIPGANSATFTTPTASLDDNNTTYSVVVHGQGPDQESAPAKLSVVPFVPVDTTDPKSLNVDEGQTATFSVAASGSPKVTYQWMKNGQAIPDATDSTYTTPVLSQADNNEQYSVLVQNFNSQKASNPAILTVNAARPPVFTGTLPDVRANPGQPATFDITSILTGSSPFHYQWTHNGLSVGDDSPTLTIPSVTQNDTGPYVVKVTNVLGDTAAATTTANLTLAPPGANLARQKQTSSSAVENPNGTASWQAVDGDPTTRWGSAIGDDNAQLTVDLGSSRVFNRVVINWENAHASAYRIQYSDNPDSGFVDAMPEITGSNGGIEDKTFPQPVKGRYVRMQGVSRATQYGYSIFEFEVYNSVGCCTNTDRYQLVDGKLDGAAVKDVSDTLSGLQWDRTQRGFTDQGAQFTQSKAIQECARDGMRLPTVDEALAISGENDSTAAFPGSWTTWTAGQDTDPTFAFQVTSQGVVNRVVAENNPGHVLCVLGNQVTAPTVTQPANQTAGAGRAAQFSVAATGTGPFSYDWYSVTKDANNNDVEAFQSSTSDGTYTTPALALAQNGVRYRAKVTSAQGLLTVSKDAVLTVDNSTNGVDPVFGGAPAGGNQPGTGDPGQPNQPGTGTPGDGQGGTNLALHAGATSSGNENQTYLVPAGAVDGDFTTRWGSDFVPEASITLDLGKAQTFDHVILRWENAYSTQYTIEVSNGNGTWTSVSPEPYVGHGGVERRDFPVQTARFVRMHSTARATQYGVSLWEFEVYTPPPPPPVTPQSLTVTAGQPATFAVGGQTNGGATYQWRHNAVAIAGATQATLGLTNTSVNDAGNYDVVVTDGAGHMVASTVSVLTVNPAAPTPPTNNPAPTSGNLALNQPVTASDTENAVAFKPSNVNDGDVGTRWSSGFTDDQWISVDLGSVKTINKVVLNWENAHATDYLIEVSLDGQQWNKADENPNSNGGVETRTFTPVSARFVRMHGVKRSTQYGYSLWEMEVYGTDDGTTPPTTPPTQPPPPPTQPNDPSQGFNYDVFPGFIGTQLRNVTNGRWSDDQIFIEVIGNDPANLDQAGNPLQSWLKPDGTLTPTLVADNNAPNHLTKNGQNFPNYAFTLAQAKLLKIPHISSGRIFVSFGEPMYMTTMAGPNGNTGYAGPNPLNATDPNINTIYDWYELTWAPNALFINTTQVDQFSIPLSLDEYGNNKTTHQNSGITQTRAEVFQEFNAEVPAEFQYADVNSPRIIAPGKGVFDENQPQGHYFDAYIDEVWNYYTTHKLEMTRGAEQYEGTVVGNNLVFHHTNVATTRNGSADAGNLEPDGFDFIVQKPTTQDVLEGKGNLALASDGDVWGVTPQLEAQLCAAFNRHVAEDVTTWKDPTQFYLQAPANYYSRFWHVHGVNQKAYGFAYDDVSDQSSTLVDPLPEHLEFGIGW